MKLGTLIVFSGLPGSGKSTLASALATHFSATYIRIDTIEQGLREICGISQIDGKGYQLAYRVAQENLRLGSNVISDSVNPWEITREEWNNVAKEVNAKFVNIEIICSDKVEHKKRAESRGASVPNLKVPTWNEILNRDYQPWSGERLQLDTSGKRLEKSLEELIEILSKAGLEK